MPPQLALPVGPLPKAAGRRQRLVPKAAATLLLQLQQLRVLALPRLISPLLQLKLEPAQAGGWCRLSGGARNGTAPWPAPAGCRCTRGCWALTTTSHGNYACRSHPLGSPKTHPQLIRRLCWVAVSGAPCVPRHRRLCASTQAARVGLGGQRAGTLAWPCSWGEVAGRAGRGSALSRMAAKVPTILLRSNSRPATAHHLALPHAIPQSSAALQPPYSPYRSPP